MVALTDAVSDTAFTAPPGRPVLIAVVRQPSSGVAGAKNRCVVVALSIDLVEFTLFNGVGKAIGPAVAAPVVEGAATFEFNNPPAGTSYRIVAQAVGADLRPVRAAAFNVSPTAEPIAPELYVDPAEVIAARVGETATLTVKSKGLPEFDWVVAQPGENNPWRSPTASRVKATGADTISVEVKQAGEFVKLMSVDRKLVVDTAKFAGPAPTPTPTPTPVVPAAATAKDFMKGLVAGVNVERGRAWTMQYNGKPLNQSVDYYRYLAGLGLTHVRMFMPVRPNADMLGMGLTGGRMPDAALIDKLLDACDCAAAAGLKVLVDWTDVVSEGELRDHWTALAAYFGLVCQRIQARPSLSPAVLATGAFNELEVEKNAAVNKYRLDAHTAFRRGLPQHTLLTGSAYWNAWDRLTDGDWAMVGDKNTIAQWHHYEDALRGPAFWADVAKKLGEFSARNGIPTICGEAGPDEGWSGQHVGYSDRWLTSMRDQAGALAGQGPMWWAVTDGGAFRFSRGGADATIRPELEDAIRSTSATLRKAQGGKS